MITERKIQTEKRKEQLNFITSNLLKFCSDNNIRLGQAISIIIHNKDIDLFNIENDKLNELFLDYISKNQDLIKE